MTSESAPNQDRVDELLVGDTLLPYTFKDTVSNYLSFAAVLPENYLGLNCRLQANLIVVAEEFDRTEAKQFILETEELLDTEIDKSNAANDDSNALIVSMMSSLDTYLMNKLGNRWIPNAEHEYYKVIRYKEGSKVLAAEVVNEDNFYFKPPEENYCETDKFPPNGKIAQTHGEVARAELISKNVSVFDPLGIKVFWGDLKYQDVSELKGTYYVMDQRSSYLDVPDYAIMVEGVEPAYDPSRPPNALTYLMPNDKLVLVDAYVKSHCFGAIVDGKFVEHDHRAEVSK